MSNTKKTLAMVNIVPIRSSIEKLKVSESESIAVQNFCNEYSKKLNDGMKEEQICEAFVNDLAKIANTESAKAVLKEVNESVKMNETNIKLANCVYNLDNSSCMFVAPMIESAVVDYMIDKNSTTRDNVKLNLSLFESDSLVQQILEALQFEQYEEKSGKTLQNVILKEEFKAEPVKTYTQDEVDKILANKMNEMETEKQNAVKKTKNSIPNHIKLSESIAAILKNNKNEKLKVFCEQYINALNNGKPDELLYESFISGISNWNYLSAVDTELSALNDRVNRYKQDISLKKILETMSQTGSYYIVPLIEDVVADYVDNKNMATRTILLQRLEAFEYDPFVRDMECLITRDLSIENTVYLGESVEYLNNKVKTELVFSPVKYIKENECVFNVKGAYFARKNNEISKLTKNEVASLSESFKALCNIVNNDNVRFSQEFNSVTIYGNENKCVINESEILLNDKEVTTDELKSLMESAINMRSNDAEFYAMSVALNEHYNDIAYIDFVKRIESKDNSGKSCDVFKLKESIFVNTTNSNLGRSTFYRNVNPIQCRNYINEHMEINCSPLFEDELPEQEKIEHDIETKKKEYQDYIDSLEEKKKTLMSMKDEAADTKDIDDAIDMIDKELEDTKKDFKKYQDDADKYLNGDEDDEDDSLKDDLPDTGDEDGDKNDDVDGGDGEDGENGEDDDKKGDELDPDKESKEDMENPITGAEGGEEEVDIEDDSDMDFPSEFDDVAEYDPDFDVPTSVTVSDTPEEGQSTKDIGYGRFQIVKVSYNKNVKSGKTNGKGEVLLLIPSVDANGDVHDDTRKVSFYLDADKKPIINNEYMPLDMYTEIVDAIENDPNKPDSVVGGDTVVEPENNELKAPGEETSDEFPAMFGDEKETSVTVETPDFKETETKDEVPVKKEDLESDDAAAKESPAETKDAEDETPNYPISVGLLPDEIAPMDMEDFEKDLDDELKIEHSKSESNETEVILKITNRAQANALRKYYKKWFSYTDDQFSDDFPELRKCFDNKPAHINVMSANEGVQIKGVKPISDSSFRIILPCNESIAKIFNIKNHGNYEQFSVVAENEQEAYKIYESLYMYARKNNGNVEQDVVDVLDAYGKKYGKLAESACCYNLSVPYNNFLKQKLTSKGFDVNVVNENMNLDIVKDDFNNVKKILESFYGDSAPIEARDFFKHVNENVTITVKDDSTGKTVTINTDELNGKSAGGGEDEAVTPDFEDSFKNVTFNPEESLAFKDDEDSADDDKDEKKDEDKKKEEEDQKKNEEKGDAAISDEAAGEEDNDDEDENGEETGDEKDKGDADNEKSEEKPKKKFKFKVKSKKASNESVADKDGNALNESNAGIGIAEPNVLDYVKCKDGLKGQIISKQADGDFIVNVQGHTRIYPKNEVEVIYARPDLVDTPFKYDEATLRGIYESYVNCGMYVNNTQVTPNDCKVQLLEYMKASDNTEINIIIEGEKTKVAKKYVRINEDLNDVMDLANYSPGTMTFVVEGVVQKTDVLVNVRDFSNYVMMNESTIPVRTLIFADNGETHLSYINGGNLMINESEDFFKPETERLMESAIAALS